MLATYLAQTRRLLQNPSAPNALYSEADLTAYINTARGQLAGESECIRAIGYLPVSASTVVYNFSSITFPVSAVTTGVRGVLNVRQAFYVVGDGRQLITPRQWEWYTQYYYNKPVPGSGAPTTWAQLGQGVAGSIYFYPVPDTGFTVTVDTVCYPIDLVTSATVEAIPYLWTDAVPYFAAYLAFLSSQNGARQSDADRMFERYTFFTNRARNAGTPSMLSGQYQQQPDIIAQNRLGGAAR